MEKKKKTLLLLGFLLVVGLFWGSRLWVKSRVFPEKVPFSLG